MTPCLVAGELIDYTKYDYERYLSGTSTDRRRQREKQF